MTKNAAFDEFIAQHENDIRRMAETQGKRTGLCGPDIDDLDQRVQVKIFELFDKRPWQNFRSWLVVVVRNEALNIAKKTVYWNKMTTSQAETLDIACDMPEMCDSRTVNIAAVCGEIRTMPLEPRNALVGEGVRNEQFGQLEVETLSETTATQLESYLSLPLKPAAQRQRLHRAKRCFFERAHQHPEVIQAMKSLGLIVKLLLVIVSLGVFAEEVTNSAPCQAIWHRSQCEPADLGTPSVENELAGHGLPRGPSIPQAQMAGHGLPHGPTSPQNHIARHGLPRGSSVPNVAAA